MLPLVDVEDDSLGEGEGLAVVDGVGGSAHVGLPAVGAGLAAAAGLLLAAEGSADLGSGRADVDVGDAAVGADGGEEGLGLGDVRVKMLEERPWGTSLWRWMASERVS